MSSLTSTRPAPIAPVSPLYINFNRESRSVYLGTDPVPTPQLGGQSIGGFAYGGIRPPQNTPSDQPPIVSKIQAGTQQRPIATFRSRYGLGNTTTPENTPNSLERITKKIAGNLLGDAGQGKKSSQIASKIAPSYERRFDAGLRDIDRLFKQQATKSPPPSPPVRLVRTLSKVDWPQSFDGITEAKTSSIESSKIAKD